MRRNAWWLVLILAAGSALVAGLVRQRTSAGSEQRPWKRVKARAAATDHSSLIRGPLADGPSVTRQCLSCHPQAARHVMATRHWTWLGHPAPIPGRAEPVRIGKQNLINNFCIGVQSNWPKCTSCHAGYGWSDERFDFTQADKVDCLVCHERTGAYRKDAAGLPAAGVDLLAAARSVGPPTRRNCGYCHFAGGGGDAVKHGDLDATMYLPSERIDVHMGRHDFACQTCHKTRQHEIAGRSMAVSADSQNHVACTDCHSSRPHDQERLNAHVSAVACQTCHIPKMAVDAATKMEWDWSAAGADLPKTAEYDKLKGRFAFARDVAPEYYWYNGTSTRYLQGDTIDPAAVTPLNYPQGSARDPQARIWPFKVHRARQIYDAQHNYLLVPKTVGKGGYWTEFDWDKAARLGSAATGLPYSGKYGFAATSMHWPLTHMVAAKEKALQCTDCHSPGGRLDWKALGYGGDPAFRGGRLRTIAAEGGR